MQFSPVEPSDQPYLQIAISSANRLEILALPGGLEIGTILGEGAIRDPPYPNCAPKAEKALPKRGAKIHLTPLFLLRASNIAHDSEAEKPKCSGYRTHGPSQRSKKAAKILDHLI